ncbi:MAG: Lrp/AsnC family transcriptional regulator [Proteobacteria bacterium]|nr:Lrp/AsnC family transcriptional regulator [Pseudomonadota bacterium]
MLDVHDRRIAAVLQADNQRTVEDIAAAVGLSSSAAHRRIARLRRDGLIRGDVAVLDPKAFGLTMTFIVEITLEKVRVDEVSVMKARLKAAPEIQQIYNVTGEADLLLIVLARDVEHFEQLSRELFSADPLVRRYKTSLVVDRVKVSLAIPT